jgi:polysaccharide export outer membrane protein
VIDVEVIGEPANTTSLVVGPDGKIYYGLLPGTFVWGLTLGEAKKVLEDSLAKYIRARPEVAVTLRTVGSKHIWLLGNVTRPGVYPVAAPMSLLESIALAGGTLAATGTAAETVDLSRSFVMRDGQPLAVDFYRLLRQGDLSQNIFLLPNDFVYLRPGISEDVYVLGGVTTPNVVVFNNQMTLVAAIAACGGPIQYAYLSHVAIIRGSLSSPMIATVNYREIVKGQAPDVLLQQGDIVYVPMSPYRYIQEFGLQVISQFVRTVAINEGRAAVDPRLGPAGVGRFLGGGVDTAPEVPTPPPTTTPTTGGGTAP